MNKFQRRYEKCKREGRCPHCGKPCAPYFECAERRAYKSRYLKGKSSYNRNLRSDDPRWEPRGKIRYWTEAEDGHLATLLSEARPVREICAALDRSAHAIDTRARKLGLPRFRKCQTLLGLAATLARINVLEDHDS